MPDVGDPADADGVRRLEDTGVTDVIISSAGRAAPGPDAQPLPVKLESLRRYADNVTAKTR